MGLQVNNSFFNEYIDGFNRYNNDLSLPCDPIQFDNSSGNTISKITTALAGFEATRTKIADLYSATSYYLNKVRDNLDTCENDNIFSEEG